MPGQLQVVVVEKDNRNRLLQGFLRLEDLLDDLFAAGVPRVRFARINDLKCPDAFRDLPQPVQIFQDQVRAFITRGPARKSDRECLGIQLQSRLLAHGFQ